ncbi:SMI1/KNR4 family protein [Nannocystis pusilla]|uniref:SMI1/KNR4 family protein n=1 Tax=Nannocystis pusilla TaxID=889268 RepID=UPI003DA497CD
MNHIDEVLLRLSKRARHGVFPLEGCTQAEIDELTQFAGRPLPDAYVKFLQLAGRNSDTITRGSDAYYPIIFELRQWAINILTEANCPYTLPHDMFVFSMHQGYEFCSFLLNGNADPAVFQFVYSINDAEGPTLQWPTFSHYIDELLSHSEAALF